MIQHFNIYVRGRVQGVFFRASAQEKAQELSITGFAENVPGGEVYIEAEGTEENLTKFVDWCHQGPIQAQVDGVDIEEAEIEGYNTFKIRR